MSAVVKGYVLLVREGKKTVEQVPALYRKSVEESLREDVDEGK